MADARVKERRRVVLGSPVNLRNEITPLAGEAVGLFISMVNIDALMWPDVPFWDLARAVREGLSARMGRGQGPMMVKLFGGLSRLLWGREGPREFARRWQRLAPVSAVLSNLGRLPIETWHGRLTMETRHFALNPSALGEFVSTAASLNGRIYWNFIWPDPSLEESHAMALIDDLLARLTAAV
jgi:hypothetical protein